MSASISADVWVALVLPACGGQALGRLAQTCRTFRDGVQHYRRSRAYGVALARAALEHARERLVARHSRCSDSPRAIRQAVDAHFGRALDDRAGAAPRPAEQVVATWDASQLAPFLQTLAAAFCSTWSRASEAAVWGLRAAGHGVLVGAFTAPAPPNAAAPRVRQKGAITGLVARAARQLGATEPDDHRALQALFASVAAELADALQLPAGPASLLAGVRHVRGRDGARPASLLALSRRLGLAERNPLEGFACRRHCVREWGRLLAARGRPPPAEWWGERALRFSRAAN